MTDASSRLEPLPHGSIILPIPIRTPLGEVDAIYCQDGFLQAHVSGEGYTYVYTYVYGEWLNDLFEDTQIPEPCLSRLGAEDRAWISENLLKDRR